LIILKDAILKNKIIYNNKMDNRILIFAIFLIIAYMLFNKRESLSVGGYIWRHHGLRNELLRDELLFDEYRHYPYHHGWRHHGRRYYHPYHHFYY
jgi:hypothetical protein